MFNILLTTYYLIFTVLAWRRLNFAVLVIIAALPSYLIRFHLGPIPMTALEGMIIIVFIVWIARRTPHFSNSTKKEYTIFLTIVRNILQQFYFPISLFLLAATVSTLISPDLRAAAGIWKAYFIEPVLFFLVLIDLFRSKSTTQSTSLKSQIPISKSQTNPNVQNPNIGHWSLGFGVSASHIITALSFTALLLAGYAIYQRFTGFGIPPPWDKELRVTSIFPYPNALGLFLAPLIPLFIAQSLAFVMRRGQKLSFLYSAFFILVTLLSVTAIIFAKSTGAIVGMAAGLLFMIRMFIHKQNSDDRHNFARSRFLILSGYWTVVTVLAALIIITIPSVKNELLLRDWSGRVRKTQWTETWNMLKDRPILGVGLAGYKETLAPYHKATYLEIFEYPHNIILNFWSETGLLGLLSFAWLVIVFLRNAPPLKVRGGGGSYELITLGAMCAMITLLTHGLVDVPYFKNDLAILFWIIFALALTSKEKNGMMQS